MANSVLTFTTEPISIMRKSLFDPKLLLQIGFWPLVAGMILYNLYRKASKKSGRPETNSSKKNKEKWKTVNCLIYEIIRKRCYSLPLTRLQLTMTRFFSLIFETFHAQRLEFVDHSWSNQPRNQSSVSVWERWQFRYNAWSAGKREWPSRDWLLS